MMITTTKRVYLSMLLGVVLAGGVFTQTPDPHELRIDQIVNKDYPNLKVYVSVEDESGDPLPTLVRGNFQARVDAQDPLERLRVESFRLTEEPVAYSVLLSVSGRLERALYYREEAILSIMDVMKDDDRLSVYTVGTEALPVFEYKTREEINTEAIRDISVTDDSPNLYDAITGVYMRKRNEALRHIDRKVIIVISDGRDANSRFDRDTLLRRAAEVNVPLYSLGVSVIGANLDRLNGLSDATGGSYQFVLQNQYDQIPARVRRMMQQIHHGYVLGFRVRGVPADDEYHQLMIGVTDREVELRSFKNFVARKVPFPFWLRIVIVCVAVVTILLLLVILFFYRRAERKKMGITKRKCPDCKRRMKDDWEFCPFCRYMPPKKKKRKDSTEG
ncbi:VWFA-related domain-containing protein [Alkalispirochaeta americana]|uniref:VWFA-related domain-containing protein n=1 Tax=Alkalispirochaeta americana TaxID=159291 RepID=A0A1N6X8H9_9SPIO|nr:VWA domain-containing protein [Alkalispirochaeta americana]SIQ98570.1 VWFA-related domain-containing protein [Alkalispirochaeta americana]